MKTRDYQRRKCYRFGWSLPKGEVLSDADASDLIKRIWAYFRMEGACPKFVSHNKNRRKCNYYRKTNTLKMPFDKRTSRRIIHEVCHAVNTVYSPKRGRRIRIGASHGEQYMATYCIALAMFHPNLWPELQPKERLSKLIAVAQNDFKLKVDSETLQKLQKGENNETT